MLLCFYVGWLLKVLWVHENVCARYELDEYSSDLSFKRQLKLLTLMPNKTDRIPAYLMTTILTFTEVH